MKRKKDIEPTIKNYEDFYELLIKQGLIFLEKNEPIYCKKFRELQNRGVDNTKIRKNCNKLLEGKLDKYIELIESLTEVGYYWKRVTEVHILLETYAPETPIYELNEYSWFAYNCDCFWHSIYSLEERLIRFLKKFKRMYRSPSIEETKYLGAWIESTNEIRTEFTKRIRDPLAHTKSPYVDVWHDGHFWEAKLISKDFEDFIDIYECTNFFNREYMKKMFKDIVLEYLNRLSFIFNQLCTFSLDRLELK